MVHAKLWKRILNEGLRGLDKNFNTTQVAADIIKSPIIVDERYGDIAESGFRKDMERVAMPFPMFFIEGSDESPDKPETNGYRWGSLVRWSKAEDKTAIVVACVAGIPGRPLLAGIARTVYPNRDDGQEWDFHGPKDAGRAIEEVLLYTFDVLSLLSCKNVSLEPHDNEPKQVRRAVKRHGGNPEDYRYHTLIVRPAGAGPHVKGEPLGIMPRHVCRGHFAEYGPEFGKGLLFGKHAGRFYVPPCVKGDKKNGTVEKDYRIPPTK